MTALAAPAPPVPATAPSVISGTLTVVVDAAPAQTRAALRRLHLADPARRALAALALDDRVELHPGGLTARWPDGAGAIDVAVDVRVEAAGEGSTLSIATRFIADGDDRERLLDAWPLIGPLADHLSRRAARSVKDDAEEDRFA